VAATANLTATARRQLDAAQVGRHTDWIIVASKDDADAVDYILKQAHSNGVSVSRVVWVERGPIKFYCCTEDLWEGLFT
jgi:hypothetical protein